MKVMLRSPANPCGPLDGVSTQYFTPAARLTGCSPIFVSFDTWNRRGTDHCCVIQSYVDWVFSVYVHPPAAAYEMNGCKNVLLTSLRSASPANDQTWLARM